MQNYLLVTDASVAEVEKATGLIGHPTPLGVLVKKPKPFRLDVELEKLDRMLHPRLCNCAIVHMPPCRFAYITP